LYVISKLLNYSFVIDKELIKTKEYKIQQYILFNKQISTQFQDFAKSNSQYSFE